MALAVESVYKQIGSETILSHGYNSQEKLISLTFSQLLMENITGQGHAIKFVLLHPLEVEGCIGDCKVTAGKNL